MQKRDLKRILTLSMTCWNSENGSDTLSNLFETYSPDKVANIYFKEGIPNSKSCDSYFLISESKVLKSIIFRRTKTGLKIDKSGRDNEFVSLSKAKEDNRYRFFAKIRLWILLLFREFLWILGKWKTDDLDKFVKEFKPDVIFSPIEGYIYFNRVLIHLAKKYNLKICGYFWDDNFTFKQHKFNIFYFLHRIFLNRQIKVIKKYANCFYFITPKAKAEFERKNKDVQCRILTKFIDTFPDFNDYIVKDEVKLVYSGKIDKGRMSDLIKLSKSIVNYNHFHDKKIFLDIFSQSHLPRRKQSKICNEFVSLKGFLFKTELNKILKQYNGLVQIEPLSGINKNVSRLSFSTKIIDYLSAGRPILCISPEDNATYRYLLDNQAAICCSSFKKINTVLDKFFDSDFMNNLLEKEKKLIFNFHNIEKREEFYKELNKVGE